MLLDGKTFYGRQKEGIGLISKYKATKKEMVAPSTLVSSGR